MQRSRISCVLIGDGSLLTQCGDLLANRDYAIKLVVTESQVVADWANARGLPLLATATVLRDGLPDVEFDWLFSIANLQMLPKRVWQAARSGAANFHDGPLPKHAGLNAPAWALLAGDTDFGVTWHAITDGADEGEIYVQKFFPIDSDETSLTLNLKCFEAGLASFGTLVDSITAGSLVGAPQDGSGRSYHARRDRPQNGATLNFIDTIQEIDRLARALDFGQGYLNPLSLPKLLTSRGAFNVKSLETTPGREGANAQLPGTVIAIDGSSASIAASDGVVRINELSDASGAPVEIATVLSAGDQLPSLSEANKHRLNAVLADVAAHEPFFTARLQNFAEIEWAGLSSVEPNKAQRWQELSFALPASAKGPRGVAALLAGLSRLSGRDRVDVFFSDDELKDLPEGYVGGSVPLGVSVAEAETVGTLSASVGTQIEDLRRKVGYAADLSSRVPGLGQLRSNVAIQLVADAAQAQPSAKSALTFIVPRADATVRVLFDANRVSEASAAESIKRLALATASFVEDTTPVAKLPLMAQSEIEDLIYARNATARDFDRTATVHSLFEAQAALTPDAIALVSGNESLSYRELDARANRVAAYLISLNVGPDVLVGLNLNRSCDLVVGALGILKAGGAYVPLDPTYPADRIAYMIKDGELATIIGEADGASAELPGVRRVTIEGALAAVPEAASPKGRSAPQNLAYVIYTSGSTGQPKGVMVEHRNVVNFFAGMDERIERPSSGQAVWLAVTSLSFDISVLELFWTLARGFKVIVQDNAPHHADRNVGAKSASGMEFGLFYWGDDDQPGSRKYQLLLEGSRFADEHGFTSVWTPERHFHSFGGPYPNPAVTGAAVAAVTKNLSIRAGSCVLPLHHPARVAEDWAIIDNLSDGRAALSFASGWMPDDFVLRPENAPPANKAALFRDIDVVRKLWRGEAVEFDSGSGKAVSVTTLPRPVQAELPVWVTTAGNPDTFREAARQGANILTHLLGQSVDEVADKVKAYRDELRAQGYDPSKFKVTIMLHTLVGKDREIVREQAREPMKRYLRSAAALIKQYAWSFPAFKRPTNSQGPMDLDLRSLEKDEMEAILEFAFVRYFEDSGLFGTVDDAIARIDQLSAIGVDEIACLIDFGVPSDLALSALQPLAEVVKAVNSRASAAIEAPAMTATSVGDLIRRHDVSHMQCTPSMAAMLLDSDDDRTALAKLDRLYIGGEALSGALVKKLGQATQASIENMYGPTETTIWSSTGPAVATEGKVPLGTPIANTQLYVLDTHLNPVPLGSEAELFIGGDGVVRGYHKRPELTAERFIDNPFVAGGRMYRTGDVVRIDVDGTLQFIGRSDYQVKVRGHRIELQEIEESLNSHAGVKEAVVIVREDSADDVRIVAYLRFAGDVVADDDLRAHVRKTLPDFMVPAHFVALEKFPLTPNLKVDRKALPKVGPVAKRTEAIYEPPASDVEKQIAQVFVRILGVEQVGLNDNFFTLGGHSLLAVQAHREIKSKVSDKISITDLYRFPTVSGLVTHLRDLDGANKHLDKIAARASGRRAAMAGRRGVARTDG
jgi:natural product biosynthesis luciferase-like monooxygenase protein